MIGFFAEFILIEVEGLRMTDIDDSPMTAQQSLVGEGKERKGER